MWKHDKHHPTDFDDPAAKQVWFANQLSDDSCASLAILNVLFNCTNVDVGEELRRFREETDAMSSVVSAKIVVIILFLAFVSSSFGSGNQVPRI